ncbi:MAG: hypothetical protein ACE5G1_10840 [bacterium]
MKLDKSQTPTLSATDLANHLACKHLTQLNRAVTEGRISCSEWFDPDIERIQQLGLAHEKAFIDHVRNQGR